MARFLPQTREILQFAWEEAQYLQAGYVGSGHLLLGLLRQDMANPTFPLFQFPGISLEQVQTALVEMNERADPLVRFTPETRRSIHFAADLARKQQQTAGTIHFLLALLLMPENQATRVLYSLGVDLEALRVQTRRAVAPEEDFVVSRAASITFPQANNSGKFTQRARQVLIRSDEEAWIFEQAIDIEHVFLGLLYESEGVAFHVLKGLAVDLEGLDLSLVQLLSWRDSASSELTPRAKRAIEFSVREAVHFGHHYIGTEHLLLGILRLCEETQKGGSLFAGVGRKRADGDRTANLFAELGLSLKRTRRKVSDLLANGMRDDTVAPPV